LKPELEDELIITVIATGFDAAYFHETDTEEPAAVAVPLNDRMTEEVVSDVDMNLDHTEAAAIFNEETPENIWSQPVEHEDESDTPAFLRRRKKRNKKTEE